MRQEARSEIAIFRPGSQQAIIIQQADRPTWSPDGEWLAYSIFGDGLYIVRKDGTGSRKVVDFGANATCLPQMHGHLTVNGWRFRGLYLMALVESLPSSRSIS
jgi:hypothetical protein